MAVLDHRPITIGHTLVLPRDHYNDIMTMPEEVYSDMYLVARKLAEALLEAIPADGIMLVTATGVAQAIKHAHVHIIPRFPSDAFSEFGRIARSNDGYTESARAAIIDKVKMALNI